MPALTPLPSLEEFNPPNGPDRDNPLPLPVFDVPTPVAGLLYPVYPEELTDSLRRRYWSIVSAGLGLFDIMLRQRDDYLGKTLMFDRRWITSDGSRCAEFVPRQSLINEAMSRSGVLQPGFYFTAIKPPAGSTDTSRRLLMTMRRLPSIELTKPLHPLSPFQKTVVEQLCALAEDHLR